jgi:hypothetical protein
MKKFSLILGLLSACAPLTPAQHVTNLKGEIIAVKAGCYVYSTQAKYPRDISLDKDCPRLLAP